MGRYREAAIKARKLTNKQLASELASMAPLNRDQLQKLIPLKRDKEAFLALMQIVEEETEMDNKLAYLGQNLKTAGVVIFKMLDIFI